MKRLLALGGATLLLALAGTLPARSQTTGGVGGYILEARSTAFDYTYSSPGMLATGDVIFQAALPDSMARLTTGPNGHARSSLAWPGPLLADLGVIAEQGTPEDQRPPFRLPPYPVRAEAFSPQGPQGDTSEAAPGARMSATAEGTTSHADARYTGMQIPGVFEFGGVTTDATSEVVDGVAVSRARTTLTDVSLLAGLIQIDSLVTDLVATSDGVAATATGGTTAAGVTFAGLAATIDETGIHLAGNQGGGNDATRLLTDHIPTEDIAAGLRQITEPASAGLVALVEGLQGGLDQLAEESGIRIKLVPETLTVDGTLGEATSTGLHLDLFYDGRTTPVFSELLRLVPIDQLPNDSYLPIPFNTSPQNLVGLLRETHINAISVGAASVSAIATESFDVGDFDFDFGDGFGSGTGTGGGLGAFTGSSGGGTGVLAGEVQPGVAVSGGDGSGGTGDASGAGGSDGGPAFGSASPAAAGKSIPGTLGVVAALLVIPVAGRLRTLAFETLRR